jgi:hypothetical protein
MTTRSWIRKLFAHPFRKRPRRARLAVEALVSIEGTVYPRVCVLGIYG